MLHHLWRQGLAGCVWAAAILCAQQPVPANHAEIESAGEQRCLCATSTVRAAVETNLVEAGIVVRDDDRRPVGGLTKDDFLIFDDGMSGDRGVFRRECRPRRRVAIRGFAVRPCAYRPGRSLPCQTGRHAVRERGDAGWRQDGDLEPTGRDPVRAETRSAQARADLISAICSAWRRGCTAILSRIS